MRFADKPKHQVFLEPEGRNTSGTMPRIVDQYAGGCAAEDLRSVPGLERAQMMRTGYAIEYDVIVADQLKPSLETKLIEGLFTAGQINGTSGYEEAGAQGIITGINAARKVQNLEPLILKRPTAISGS